MCPPPLNRSLWLPPGVCFLNAGSQTMLLLPSLHMQHTFKEFKIFLPTDRFLHEVLGGVLNVVGSKIGV